MESAVVPEGQEFSEAERFRLLVGAITDYAIYMLDRDGRITTWNSGARNLNLYRADEIIGQHYSRFFTPEDQAAGIPDRILEEARIAGRHESEGWRVRKDGNRFWASVTVHPILTERGALVGFAKITRDISERVAAEQALRDSEGRFRLLVEGVVDYAIYMLDPAGIITNWNAGAQRMKGYRAEEIVGQHFSRFYLAEDRAAALPARVLDTARREGRFEAEGWRVRKDGTRFWASVVVDAIRSEKGELLGYAKITRDITERRAAQDALSESERQFRLLVKSVTDYALYMLDPGGIVSSWNEGAQRIKGYTAEEIIGQHFSRFYTERDRASGLPTRALETALREGRFEADGWRVRKDGTLFWANVIIDPIRDDDGTLTGFAKITRDISERREAQLALEQAHLERSRAQKMEALGQLTGGVAHDFNNLLMIVGGYIGTIKKAFTGDPKVARAVQAIELAVKRGESLTRQLLTFSRRQTLKPEVTTIPEVLSAFETMLGSYVGSSVEFAKAIPLDVWPVKIDPSEFELALVNLTINARDAMPNGGTVTMTAANVRLKAGDTSERLEGEFVALEVADTGSGIAPDILSKVFDPFFTTKPVGKGTGLGLSQVHGFVHQSGGTLSIASALGEGTKVTLYLPRAQDDAAAADPDAPAVVRAGGVVLLVEDHPLVADVSAELIEQLGYEVKRSSNAEAALEIIAHEPVDLVISDIVMAGKIDGLGLGRAVRELKPDVPLLLVSGYSEAATRADNEFVVLRKPFGVAELHRAIAKVVAEHQGPSGNLVDLRVRRRVPLS